MDKLNANSSSQIAISAIRLRVRGVVQGVGFRPTVWNIANQLGLFGEVLNDGDGVLIHLQGDSAAVEQFEATLLDRRPPLAIIEDIITSNSNPINGLSGFNIRTSDHQSNNTGVSPDAVICDSCIAEIRNPLDRRHGYAFSNCTHCGPRLSIIRAIPYDRQQTSMVDFEMCAKCLAEYKNPADRRFHAQPNACPDCGPTLWIEDANGKIQADSVITYAAELIRSGKIIAIKGIGGFHLACDATNPEAIAQLRQRKHRPHKAFAMMAANIEQIERYCLLNEAEIQALQTPAAPIVILQSRWSETLPGSVAPGLQQLGFMLPYSPLHILLMDQLINPIVLTSGNLSEEPQCIDNHKARKQLAGIADAFVMFDRDIVNRIDDSVVRYLDGEIRCQRRARGYAPTPLSLPDGFSESDSILALGAEMKNTFCLIKSGHAIVSQHMGDLENYASWRDFETNLQLYKQLFEHDAKTLAIDQHPEYLSSKLGQEWAVKHSLQLEEVQHHHAHVAACLSDAGWPLNGGKVLAITLDGLGYANDGTLWGGEILLADYHSAERLAHLRPVAMPGGSHAIRQPWRNSYAHIREVVNWPLFATANGHLEIVQLLSSKPIESIDAMIDREQNSPLSSSCGRLFDAVAGAIGIASEQLSYEGQAAMEMEALLGDELSADTGAYKFEFADSSPWQIDARPMWRNLLSDLTKGSSKATIAARFHNGLQQTLVNVVKRLCVHHGVQTVALSGGVFQNRRLLQGVSRDLRANHLSVLQHRTFPCNDGSIALGQALVAAARQLTNSAKRPVKP